MTAILLLLVLFAGLSALGAYARHDRYAGPRNVCHARDDLGVVSPHLVRL